MDFFLLDHPPEVGAGVFSLEDIHPRVKCIALGYVSTLKSKVPKRPVQPRALKLVHRTFIGLVQR
jgi:hypothetical protein